MRRTSLSLRRLLGASALVYAFRGGGAALTLLTQALLLRWAGAHELGVFVFTFAAVSVAAFASTFGISAAVNRFLPRYLDANDRARAAGYIDTARLAPLAAGAAAGAAGIAALAIFGSELPERERLAYLLGACAVPFSALLIANADIGRALLMLFAPFLPNMVLRQAIFLAAAAGLQAAGAVLDAAILAAVMLATLAGLAVFQTAAMRRAVATATGGAAPIFERRAWAKAGLPLAAVFGFSGFFAEINVAAAGFFVPSADLAVYNLAFQIVNLAAFFLTAVGWHAGPIVGRLLAERRRGDLQVFVRRAAAVRLVFALLLTGLTAVFGRDLLALIGTAFAQGHAALLVLALGQAVSAVTGLSPQFYAALPLHRAGLAVTAAAAAANLALIALLAPDFGIEGAAFAVLITLAIWETGILLAVNRAVGFDVSVLAALRPRPPRDPGSRTTIAARASPIAEEHACSTSGSLASSTIAAAREERFSAASLRDSATRTAMRSPSPAPGGPTLPRLPSS